MTENEEETACIFTETKVVEDVKELKEVYVDEKKEPKLLETWKEICTQVMIYNIIIAFTLVLLFFR